MAFHRSIILFFFAIPVFAYTQQAPPANTQNTNATRPLKVADYDKLISHYRYLNPDSAIYYVKEAISVAKQSNDDNGLAQILNQEGMIKDNLGQFDDSRQNYIEALELYKHTGLQRGIATENIRLGVVENRKGNYDKAIRYFLEALRVSDQSKNQPGRMEAYLTLSEVYMFQNKTDTALNYLNTAERINKTLPFSNLSLNIYNNFGVLYRETGDYDKAKSYLEKGLALSNQPQLQGLNITLTNTLAALYAKQGFKDKAIELQKGALAKAQAIHNYIREYQTLIAIAENYGQEHAAQALVYFKQALTEVQAKGGQKQAVEILGRIADMYHYMGNDKQAYLAKQEQYDIADKYFYKSMIKQVISLQNGYELSKSQASVQRLTFINSRQALVNKVILYLAAGIVFGLASLAMFYYRTRKLNVLLNNANAELTESNTVKDKLFSVLAHDLRAPFSTIIGLLQLINDDALPADERKELIDLVSVTSSASLDILNNLLKWGEMQLKGIRLNPVKVNPHPIIDRNIAVLSGGAETKSIQINQSQGTDIDIIADADHFEFVLRNLLSNAIKFTPDGGTVTISADNDTSANQVQFMIRDTGVGIPSDKLGQIFKLTNISTEGTNNEKGTSLGLVLCKEFIEANHGRIWAESEPGKGSRFIFTLPKAD